MELSQIGPAEGCSGKEAVTTPCPRQELCAVPWPQPVAREDSTSWRRGQCHSSDHTGLMPHCLPQILASPATSWAAMFLSLSEGLDMKSN